MKLWARAAGIAAGTPASRNRLVDFLRAASILAVISGHWLVAAPHVGESGFTLGNMIELSAYTRWLSWLFQVMPVFFIVGGYANGVSWRAALRDGKPFAVWLDTRLRRLLLPVLPLIACWALFAPLAIALGVDAATVQAASRVAVIPVWFLAIYTVIILFVPLSHAAWQRWGFLSFIVPALLAILDDVLFFAGFRALGWLNYLFVWIAVHQLGFAWLDGRIPSALARLGIGCFGFGLLWGLTVPGPYPVAMISVPDAALSNTLPPKLTLLALAVAQAGLLLAAEAPLRRWLDRPTPWTGAVLLNGMIMTIYLWHSTAMILVIAAAVSLGNIGLALEPASGAWWLARPAWLACYLATLAALMPLVARFERLPASTRHRSLWRLIAGAVLGCFGLALIAYFGLGGATAWTVQLAAVLTPFLGAWLAGLLLPPGRAAPGS